MLYSNGIVCFLSLMLAWSEQAQSSCEKLSTCSCECSQGIIDLQDLGSKNGPRYKDVVAPDQNMYSYNPCDAFTETNAQAFEDHCHDVAACQVIQNSGTFQYYDTGTQDSVTFYTTSGTEVGIVDMPADVVVAKYKSGDGARETEVVLVCNDQSTDTAFDTFGEVTNPTPLYRFILVTPLACFVPSNPLSGGSILIIIVVSFLFVYLTVGLLVNKFMMKKSGKDLVPNLQFWAALPGFTKDGFRFVIAKCTRREYSTM